MTLREIVLDLDGPVATVTLNRPERLNAYTPTMGLELFGSLAELDRDEAVRAIIITGSGRCFCAGADLAAGETTFAGSNTWDEAVRLEKLVHPLAMRTPVICAINGPAVGVGATLPLQWDIRIASERARFGFLFVRRGITPEAGSTWLLPRLIGAAKAAELLLTGRMISAGEALALGLVSRVVAQEALEGTAKEIAREIAENTSPVAVGLAKRLIWRNLVEPNPFVAKEREDAIFHFLGRSKDAAEGVTAFLEKRLPVFTMSRTDIPPELEALFELE
ncbi:MAG: enoyl-CoA hydratase/isomerase family protein [Deltaproteobacteria bacterium]|nr:enoyl-CoA hydratase/isomerase family protein [Deltaproteobacteria bacterium]